MIILNSIWALSIVTGAVWITNYLLAYIIMDIWNNGN